MCLERLRGLHSLGGLEGVEGLERLGRRSWALNCFFRFYTFKNPETQKQDWKKTYLFIVTDRSDRYLSSRPVYLNSIFCITISNIVNKLQ